jgi:hypothetical protein
MHCAPTFMFEILRKNCISARVLRQLGRVATLSVLRCITTCDDSSIGGARGSHETAFYRFIGIVVAVAL